MKIANHTFLIITMIFLIGQPKTTHPIFENIYKSILNLASTTKNIVSSGSKSFASTLYYKAYDTVCYNPWVEMGKTLDDVEYSIKDELDDLKDIVAKATNKQEASEANAQITKYKNSFFKHSIEKKEELPQGYTNWANYIEEKDKNVENYRKYAHTAGITLDKEICGKSALERLIEGGYYSGAVRLIHYFNHERAQLLHDMSLKLESKTTKDPKILEPESYAMILNEKVLTALLNHTAHDMMSEVEKQITQKEKKIEELEHEPLEIDKKKQEIIKTIKNLKVALHDLDNAKKTDFPSHENYVYSVYESKQKKRPEEPTELDKAKEKTKQEIQKAEQELKNLEASSTETTYQEKQKIRNIEKEQDKKLIAQRIEKLKKLKNYVENYSFKSSEERSKYIIEECNKLEITVNNPNLFEPHNTIIEMYGKYPDLKIKTPPVVMLEWTMKGMRFKFGYFPPSEKEKLREKQLEEERKKEDKKIEEKSEKRETTWKNKEKNFKEAEKINLELRDLKNKLIDAKKNKKEKTINELKIKIKTKEDEAYKLQKYHSLFNSY